MSLNRAMPQALKDRPAEYESTFTVPQADIRSILTPARERLIDDTIHACIVKLMGMGIIQYGQKGWDLNMRRLEDYARKVKRERIKHDRRMRRFNHV